MNQFEVHPSADIFPMMSDDELTSLAADIKANGLLHPIVVDNDGTLIDGRNRLRACEIAGVEPEIVSLNGHDPIAFIVSANLARRNLNKGQQAMALAMIYPEPHSAPRGKCLETQQFDRTRLSQARSVLRHSRALAEGVLADRKKLDEALAVVKQEREASASVDARMAELRAGAPEIAAMVDDERLTLEAGLTELRQRQQKMRQLVDDARAAIAKIADIPVLVAIAEQGIFVADDDLLAGFDPDAIKAAITRLAVYQQGGNE